MSDFINAKALCDQLVKNPSPQYAGELLTKLGELNHPQDSQDYFLTHLLIIVDNLQARNENELKMILIQCINKVLERTKLTKELSYKTLLLIMLKTCYDLKNNRMKENLSEEFKISVMNCFNLASRNLDSDVIENALNKRNLSLLAQCIFVATEMIENEKFRDLRLAAIKAIESLMQTHIDPSDIVLREQVSQTIFIICPKIVTLLIKVTQEETINGPSVVVEAIRALGGSICLILEDYHKQPSKNIVAEDFLNLLGTVKQNDKNDVLGISWKDSKDKEKYFESAVKSNEWVLAASDKLQKPLELLKRVRGDPHSAIRLELAMFSSLLIEKCLVNIQCFAPFLLENLILLSDDEDEVVKQYSQKALCSVFEEDSSSNKLRSQLFNMFSSHLSVMPRAIHMGDENDQLAAVTLLNGYINFILNNCSISALIECQVVLDKLMNVLLNCCELEMQSNVLLHEQFSQNVLQDEFYQMKTPWKKFKNLKNDKVVLKIKEVCHSIGKSSLAPTVVNFLMDNVNSAEYLVLLNEILCVMEKESMENLYESIMEEFSDDVYWSMPHIHQEVTKIFDKANDNQLEEWYEDKTQVLYESGIEIRLKSVSLESQNLQETNQSTTRNEIKYNVLCTCLVLELVANVSRIMSESFQPYLHKLLHRILIKAGSSNFCISNAGVFALESIAEGLHLENSAYLINQNLDFLLYNIEKKLKKNSEVDHILDIVSVIFRFTSNSMTSHIEKLVLTILHQMDQLKFGSSVTSYLKLFKLYLATVQKDNVDTTLVDSYKKSEIKTHENFLAACLGDLKPDVIDNEEDVEVEEIEDFDLKPEELPPQVSLASNILYSTIQNFASKSQVENILALDIFLNGLPILQNYQDTLLPLVHQLWYPFTKQFQGKNLVVLQKSFDLLLLIAQLVKDFIHKKVLNDVIPVLNTFLLTSLKRKEESTSIWTQQMKLQNKILNNYGSLVRDLDIEERETNEIIDVLLKFKDDADSKSSVALSLKHIKKINPTLLELKMKFLKC